MTYHRTYWSNFTTSLIVASIIAIVALAVWLIIELIKLIY